MKNAGAIVTWSGGDRQGRARLSSAKYSASSTAARPVDLNENGHASLAEHSAQPPRQLFVRSRQRPFHHGLADGGRDNAVLRQPIERRGSMIDCFWGAQSISMTRREGRTSCHGVVQAIVEPD